MPRRRGIISFWLSLFAGFFISTVFYLWSEDETVCEWLYFRTTEDNLRKAFEQFVNLVMDKVANRPRGFAFLRYETEEESLKAIQGMHGKVTRSKS
ncbi:unnamed protein product [Brassica napus]|uniref:(rape) hypothetical protein n=1 Tax=Brassica napus TaxID=3708 RepID=A0A816UYD1_BRANA|nr:unnamed protein product [Brassica napus]